MWQRTGISFRLHCMIGFLLLCSSLASIAITVSLSRQALEGEMCSKTMPVMVDNIATSIEHQLSAPANTLRTLGRSPLLLEWIAKGEDQAQLPLLVQMSRDFMDIYKAQAAYIELLGSLTIYEITPTSIEMKKIDPVRDTWFFDFGKAGMPVGINIFDTKDPAHAWTVFINTRVEDADGRFLGQLATAFTAEDFMGHITAMKIGEKGVSFVVQKNGDIILHPDTKRIWTKLADLPGFAGMAEQMLRQPEHSFSITDEHGERILVVGREIPQLNAVAFTLVSADELVMSAGMVWKYAALAGLAVFGIGFLLSALLAKSIARSQRRGSHSAE